MNGTVCETDKSITIVTAFFDIGRGDWSVDNGHPSYLHRDNETYLSYFKNLSKLDNEMIVFTSKEFAPYIRKAREGRPTEVIIIDIDLKFKYVLNRIKDILRSDIFQSKIPEGHRHNPEYWSEKYVLITNLKTYFVNKAIQNFDLLNDLVAWIDFGYCRNNETILNIKNWYYPFDDRHIHFFTIKRYKYFSIFKNPRFPTNRKQVISAILNNKVYVIGGVTVGHQHVWEDFSIIVDRCQKDLLLQNLVDDDQGIYLMCHIMQPDLFKFHYLGKNKEGKPNWFGVMQSFSKKTALIN